MSKQKEIIEQLKHIKSSLEEVALETQCSKHIYSDIKNKLNIEIPTQVCKLIIHEKSDISDMFLGYHLLGLNEIRSQYENKFKEDTFFGRYLIDQNFNVQEGMSIVVEDNYQMELLEPIEIKNLSNYLPIFEFQGDFIVVNLRSDPVGELMVITHGHLGSILAPSIDAHLNDLLTGLIEGQYKIFEDVITYPSSWYQRKGVRSGKLEMNEYGEIITQN